LKSWHVAYWENDDGSCPVQDWLDSLPQPQLKMVAKKLILLEKCGNELKMPHSKPLKQGLFELRELSFGLRIYYCFAGNKIIILLHAAGKKAQPKDIAHARGLIAKMEKEGRSYEVKKF
jgi:putative addiction module killer protein